MGNLFNTLFLVGGVAAVAYFVVSYLAPLPVVDYVKKYNPAEAARLQKIQMNSLGAQYADVEYM